MFSEKIHEKFTETIQKSIYKETIMVYNMPMFRKGGIEMIESFVNIESASQLAGNVPFLNFVEADERVTSCSAIEDGRDCAITVRCKNMSALEMVLDNSFSVVMACVCAAAVGAYMVSYIVSVKIFEKKEF